MSGPPIRIATRASRLALWQAGRVADLIRAADPGRDVELVHVTTTGDRVRSRPLSEFGGVGVFTREVQAAVLDGRADLAVHSLKDLPTETADGLTLGAVPERAPPDDALLLSGHADPAAVGHARAAPAGPLDLLAPQARVGTGSLRRQAQLLHHRPDLRALEVRGNVETRIQKLDAGEYDALVLAAAGLARLGLAGRIALELRPPLLYPAVGQGALGIECRAEDDAMRAVLAGIDDAAVHAAAVAERTVLSELRAGCHAPLGALTELDEDRLTLRAIVLSRDGRERMEAAAAGSAADPVALGRRVADDLRVQGAERFVTDPRRAE